MSLVRALDANGDWTFGTGRNSYKARQAAVAQRIKSRLLSFFQDCFFDADAGIDWFRFLGAKDQIGLKLAISSTILNTPEVTKLLQVSFSLNADTREFNLQYQIQTVYSTFTQSFQTTIPV